MGQCGYVAVICWLLPLNMIVYALKSLIMWHKERPYSSYGTFITVKRTTVRAAHCVLNFRNGPFSGVGGGGGGGGAAGTVAPLKL